MWNRADLVVIGTANVGNVPNYCLVPVAAAVRIKKFQTNLLQVKLDRSYPLVLEVEKAVTNSCDDSSVDRSRTIIMVSENEDRYSRVDVECSKQVSIHLSVLPLGKVDVPSVYIRV